MPARLIINADDFGLTAGINRAVEELYREGVLTSATLMANGPAFDHAVAVARRNPGLGVGCHVVLIDGVPVTSPDSIGSLIAGNCRSFRSSLSAFEAAALLGLLREDELCTETLAQIRKIQAAGVAVTHLDTHKHTHVFPVVNRALFKAARLAAVRAIRNPFEQGWSVRSGGGSGLRRLEVSAMRWLQGRFLSNVSMHGGSAATTDGTIGISTTGCLNQITLRAQLECLPEGMWELVCHPGYDDSDLGRVKTRLRSHREIERRALLTVVPKILSLGSAPLLVHYGDLHDGRVPKLERKPPSDQDRVRPAASTLP